MECVDCNIFRHYRVNGCEWSRKCRGFSSISFKKTRIFSSMSYPVNLLDRRVQSKGWPTQPFRKFHDAVKSKFWTCAIHGWYFMTLIRIKFTVGRVQYCYLLFYTKAMKHHTRTTWTSQNHYSSMPVTCSTSFTCQSNVKFWNRDMSTKFCLVMGIQVAKVLRRRKDKRYQNFPRRANRMTRMEGDCEMEAHV